MEIDNKNKYVRQYKTKEGDTLKEAAAAMGVELRTLMNRYPQYAGKRLPANTFFSLLLKPDSVVEAQKSTKIDEKTAKKLEKEAAQAAKLQKAEQTRQEQRTMYERQIEDEQRALSSADIDFNEARTKLLNTMRDKRNSLRGEIASRKLENSSIATELHNAQVDEARNEQASLARKHNEAVEKAKTKLLRYKEDKAKV